MADKQDDGQTLESGNIYFFYRPRVEERQPEGKSDIQQFYVVLNPERPQERYRLMIIGRERLPEATQTGTAREWGFVEMVRKDPKSIREALGEETYETKTRGKRHRPPARPCGEGVYRIVRHGNHTHLAYVLELPEQPNEVQQELEVAAEASYVISVKNPSKGSPRAAGLDEKRQADYPQALQEIFHGRRFAEVDPPDFLNHEGAEFILVSASKDVQEELGIELEADDESKHSADVFQQMQVDQAGRPVQPLFEGKWS